VNRIDYRILRGGFVVLLPGCQAEAKGGKRYVMERLFYYVPWILLMILE
jgi:hypothetical protein